ncbi:membrane-associated tyrosine- and threonine-specific cdc2-inhibitory kinase wee-1.3 isoform X2 [Tribolium madens]|uniref:membrane-associated tyrosine- and threonine-specific cdc2-inhibitory kinase wee-1.3 isoform X2 n=1 Tax=Tribolium madens TaxID=41895 RepID=UPI001CF76206|nr:membrane-associated tyrosine- and threonine-specific cdc2-inhibitory kinase wee-1.3 isoform X2 [Tribolium madens]
MDTRKRGLRSAPPKGHEYATKKDVAGRRSFPPCPPLPAKVNRRMNMSLFQRKSPAKPVSFNHQMNLSPLYDPDKDPCYFDQIFVKESVIGEGSFGVVFKVKSEQDGKFYAVKQLKSSHASHYGYAEVENYEKIGEHNNCVKFIMAWEELKIVHIQMEYCDLSLAQYAALTHKIGESQLWEILYDMLKALDYLHSKNLIHLDVKPGNIMMSQGFYKLADFGLLVDLNKHDGKKISTISDGDAKYLACEVLDGIYTYSCDIFGLGISLLELATNIELPEFGPLWHQIRKQYLPASFYDGVTKSFAVTIEKMMAKIHWQRPQASKLLKNTHLKKIQKQDSKQPRNVYYEELPREPCIVLYKNNNNNVETPPKSNEKIHDNFCGSSCRDSHERISPNRRLLCRGKLAF